MWVEVREDVGMMVGRNVIFLTKEFEGLPRFGSLAALKQGPL